jgi:hypothetical protein
MPETGFVLAGLDKLTLTEAALQMGAVLVPYLHYPTKRFPWVMRMAPKPVLG